MIAVLPVAPASAWQVETAESVYGLAIANDGRVVVTGLSDSGLTPIARVYTRAGDVAFVVPGSGQRGYAESTQFDADGNLYMVVRQPDFVGVKSYDASGVLRWSEGVSDAAHIPTLARDGKVLVTASSPPTITALRPNDGSIAFSVPVANYSSAAAIEYIHAYVGGFVSLVGRAQFFSDTGEGLGDFDAPPGYELLGSGAAGLDGSAYGVLRASGGDRYPPLSLAKWTPAGFAWKVAIGVGEPFINPPEVAVLPNGNVALGIGPGGGVSEGVTILSRADGHIIGAGAFDVPPQTHAVKAYRVDFSADDRGNVVMTYSIRFGCSIAPCVGFQAELFDGTTGQSAGPIVRAYDPEPSPDSWGFYAASEINAGTIALLGLDYGVEASHDFIRAVSDARLGGAYPPLPRAPGVADPGPPPPPPLAGPAPPPTGTILSQLPLPADHQVGMDVLGNNPEIVTCGREPGDLTSRILESIECGIANQIRATKCGFAVAGFIGYPLKAFAFAKTPRGFFDLRRVPVQYKDVLRLYNRILLTPFSKSAPKGFRNGEDVIARILEADTGWKLIQMFPKLKDAVSRSDYIELGRLLFKVAGLGPCIDGLQETLLVG